MLLIEIPFLVVGGKEGLNMSAAATKKATTAGSPDLPGATGLRDSSRGYYSLPQGLPQTPALIGTRFVQPCPATKTD